MRADRKMPKAYLSEVFWHIAEPHAYQRVTTAEWREMLLADQDRPIIRGHLRRIVGKVLGAGVVELRLQPLDEKE